MYLTAVNIGRNPTRIKELHTGQSWFLASVFLYSRAMKSIQPLSKSKLVALGKLQQKKYRGSTQSFLVEGLRAVAELLDSDWQCESVVVTERFLGSDDASAILERTQTANIPMHLIRSRDLERIADTENPQGIAAVVRKKIWSLESLQTLSSIEMLVALDSVAEPGNLGTIIRSCDWFGVDAVLVGKGSADVFNPKAVRSTMGSLFRVPIIEGIDLVKSIPDLKRDGFHIAVAASEGGLSIRSFTPDRKVVVIFGNEAQGVSRQLLSKADVRISIPRYGTAESLSVAAAAAVVLAWMRLAHGKPSV